MPRRTILALVALVAATATTLSAQRGNRQPSPSPPRLVVMLVVDQMRADYVTRFRADWTRGLKRLLDEGAWFTNAAFPYLETFTCSGHATIATGAFPSRHGVFQNAWWDRAAKRNVTCTEDAAVRAIGYDGSSGPGNSAVRLLVPTFGEEMRRQRSARVVTLSLKARSAIMLAGRGADAVTWLGERDGWETASAFARGPVPAVKAFVDANPIEADYGKTWTRLLPEARYSGADDGAGEGPPRGWTSRFPHPLAGGGRPDAQFLAQWESSPLADAYLGRFAAGLVASMRLGTSNGADVLGVGFSSPDNVGHAFGPRSHEVQDMFLHLDRTIGTLLDRLDILVGREQYVVVLTSDHGVSEVPEQLQHSGQSGGRLTPARLTDRVERAARAAAGPGRYVASLSGNDVYFAPGMYEKLVAAPGAISAVVGALASEPGIARVFHREQLVGQVDPADDLQRAAALSYVQGRSGELILAPRSGFWTLAGSLAAHHGTANAYDQRVPIVFMGPGIRRGQYGEAATPADIVPTLASLSGIAMPQVQGRVLRSAISAVSSAATAGSAVQ